MQIQTDKKDLGSLIGLCAVVAIVLLVVMAAFGPGTRGGNAWSYLTSGNPASQAPASGNSIVGGPSISADFINQMLSKYDSPAAGTGQDLYALGQQYHVDPAFALSVFWAESNFGKAGEASYTHSLGNLRPVPDEAYERDGYAAFYTWPDGYRAFYKLIAGPLYVGCGLSTPEAIIPKYAPSEDNNSPSHYIGVVNSAMALWRSGKIEVPA